MAEVDPYEFREIVLRRLEALFPDLTVERLADPLRLGFEQPDGTSSVLALENILREYRDAVRGAIDPIACVDAHLKAVARPQLATRPGHLVVMVKRSDFVEAARVRGTGLTARPLAGGLHVVLAWDQPDAVVFATDIPDPERSFEVAARNLLRLVEPRLEGDGPWRVTCGGTYEASLLATDLWPKVAVALGVRGRLLACVPTRDVLWLGDEAQPQHVAALRGHLRDALTGAPAYRLSRDLLALVDGRWEARA